MPPEYASVLRLYMGVTIAEAVDAVRGHKIAWATFGVVGTVILLWPLYNSVYPVLAYPGNLWPYVVIVYLIVGAALLAARPVIGRISLAEAESSSLE